jgi:hypothetical protein
MKGGVLLVAGVIFFWLGATGRWKAILLATTTPPNGPKVNG